MKKSDKSKHNICIASIKRSTFKPYDYKFTKFYESNGEFTYSGIGLELKENELIICSTVIYSDNYSILTTQRLISNKARIKTIGKLINSKDNGYGMFKSTKDDFVFGSIRLESGIDLEYFIETGKASMIMIHGVRTLIRTQEMTVKNIENMARIWNKKNEK
ncbi:hypothetical protein [Tenacibaculum halocynthiae]|uniref:hypothetical protein n=1 Tax=Tenacibaculum halocynthiae TaxID=1254437 RepID=UPI003893E963